MTIPSTLIYVRPGWNSATWTYAGTAMPSGGTSSSVTAVAFDASSSLGQILARGTLQYSVDKGTTWNTYMAPLDGQGAWVSAAGTTWRFHDQMAADAAPNTFSAHYLLADGSTATVDNTVIVDDYPVGLTGHNDLLLTTLQPGDTVDTLAAVDTGSALGGRWLIDSQSQPGLFAIAYDPAVDTEARLVLANGAPMPAPTLSATVTVHYYDRYQLDTGGNPIAGQGVTRTLTYHVEDGRSHDLPGLTGDMQLGSASAATAPTAALARLSTGGFAAVWQGADASLHAQLRDIRGNVASGDLLLTPVDGQAESQPAVTALAGGRFAVAYVKSGGGTATVAYRVVEADGKAGAEHVLAGGAPGATSMPALATLADGSFAIAWKSAGSVHVQQAGADGTLVGAQQDYTALGSAFSPAIAAHGTGYAVSWGEMNDGNIYAALSSAHTAFVVSGDGYAASIATAAPLPHMAALADGGFVVAWDSYMHAPFGFTISDIFFQRYDSAGRAVGAMTQANVDSTGGQFDAAVSGTPDGGFVVSWQADDGDGFGIFGRRFGADGAAIDAHEFQINEQRAGSQAAPDIVGLDGGGFAAAWTDTAAGGAVTLEARVLPGVAPAQAQAQAASTVSAGAGAQAAAVVGVQHLDGSAGNDTLGLPGGYSVLDGHAGLDTVLAGVHRADATFVQAGAGYQLVDAAGSHATLLDIERVAFGDGMVALDLDGTAGAAYRLYRAAFDRTPDEGGLGYWIKVLDSGASLFAVADGFVNSAEFESLYGAHATDSQFVQALYANTLHRAPDAAGFNYWVDVLHMQTRGAVLASFSESPENQAQVIGSIQGGIHYLQWG